MTFLDPSGFEHGPISKAIGDALGRLFDMHLIAARALELVGTPFLHQGRNPATGIDCLGLVVLSIGPEAAAVDQRDYAEAPEGERLCAALDAHFERIPFTAIDEVPPGAVLAFWLGHARRDCVRHLAIRVEGGMVHAYRPAGQRAIGTKTAGVRFHAIEDRDAERIWGAFRWRGGSG